MNRRDDKRVRRYSLQNLQIDNTFSNLGYSDKDGYHINKNCNILLSTILHNILTEDQFLLSYRRQISVEQNIKKDLIPLLIHSNQEKTIQLIIVILIELSTPRECLPLVREITKCDYGREILLVINDLLASTKIDFTDHRVTGVVIDFMKANLRNSSNKYLYLPPRENGRLSHEQCINIDNSLMLLRNILHIPEETVVQSPDCNGSAHTAQNKIVRNMFRNGIDRVIIRLLNIPDASFWCATLAQFIALLYKDQNVNYLYDVLGEWLEASAYESSDDNESNTSETEREPEPTSYAMTVQPGTEKMNEKENKGWKQNFVDNNEQNGNQTLQLSQKDNEETENNNVNEKIENDTTHANAKIDKSDSSQNSEYSRDSDMISIISSSSDENDWSTRRPVYQTPHIVKLRVNNKVCSRLTEQKHHNGIKRGKSFIINMKRMSDKMITDDNISNLFREFTVDFLYFGYNDFVKTLHREILSNSNLNFDTSHFFWLIAYFMKFVKLFEMDLELVRSVMSYDIVSYLVAEGANLCEYFQLAIKVDGKDLTQILRSLHLIVGAIRELVETIEMYKKFDNLSKDHQEFLVDLQIKMCETEELRSLFVLFLRVYDPNYNPKQYLQDIIITNHILLMFMGEVMTIPEYNCSFVMMEHVRQFASNEIIYKYGLILEDYSVNGEYLNDAIFKLMHHVTAKLNSIFYLYQPIVMKTFASILRSGFELDIEWMKLIFYFVKTYIKPDTSDSIDEICLKMEAIDMNKPFPQEANANEVETNNESSSTTTSKDQWKENGVSSLSWKYKQCSAMPDIIGGIIELFKQDGMNKSRKSVIRELYKKNLINKDEFRKYIKGEGDKNVTSVQVNKDVKETEIRKLCKQILQDGRADCLEWLQKLLLEICYVKLYFAKMIKRETMRTNGTKLIRKHDVMSPVAYYAVFSSKSVPLVPWNSIQAATCKDAKFLKLAQKLGFYLPADSGRVFIRIPHSWRADFLYEVACNIAPVDTTNLKFSMDELSEYKKIKFSSCGMIHSH